MTEKERERRIEKLKEIVKNASGMEDAVDLLITNDLCLSKAEAKRVYIQAGGNL